MNSLVNVEIEQLAQQLTLYEAQISKGTKLREFMKMRWQKNKAEAPTLVALSDHFNKV